MDVAQLREAMDQGWFNRTFGVPRLLPAILREEAKARGIEPPRGDILQQLAAMAASLGVDTADVIIRIYARGIGKKPLNEHELRLFAWVIEDAVDRLRDGLDEDVPEDETPEEGWALMKAAEAADEAIVARFAPGPPALRLVTT